MALTLYLDNTATASPFPTTITIVVETEFEYEVFARFIAVERA